MAEGKRSKVRRQPRRGIKEGFQNERLLAVPGERLREVSRQPVLRDLRVTHIGLFANADRHLVVRQKGAPEHLLIYCMSGRGGGAVGRKTFEMEAGDLVILPPNAGHRYFADLEAPWTIFWLHFTGSRAADYVKVLGFGKAGEVLHAPRPGALQSAFEETYRHALGGFTDAGMLGMSTSLARMLGLFRIYSRSRSPRARRTEDRVLEAIRRIQSEPMHPWVLEELASDAGLSVPHFSERFRIQTGSPPGHYVIRQRLQRATALMQRADLTISVIAEMVGYHDPYYFSRVFKRHMGKSPAKYRKDLLGE